MNNVKNITVEVTDAQAEYINALADQLPVVQPGDLMLALAFNNMYLDRGIGSDENAVEMITAAIKAFVGNRRLPTLPSEKLYSYGVNSRAPRPLPKEASAEPAPTSIISVEVTAPQAAFIDAVCREAGGVRPGDMLLSQAFTCFAQADETDQTGSCLLSTCAGLKAFVVERAVPDFDPDKFNIHSVRSKPASALAVPAETAAKAAN